MLNESHHHGGDYRRNADEQQQQSCPTGNDKYIDDETSQEINSQKFIE